MLRVLIAQNRKQNFRGAPSLVDGGSGSVPSVSERDRFIKILKGVLAKSPGVAHLLVEHRVEVNLSWLTDDDLDVVLMVDSQGKHPELGMLGVINGFLGDDNRIAAIFDDKGKLTDFKAFQLKPVP